MSRVRQRKWAILAAAGSVIGITLLLLFRSIPVAAGATSVVVAIIVLKHLALAMIVGSPVTAAFQSIKPTIRSHCPFAKS